MSTGILYSSISQRVVKSNLCVYASYDAKSRVQEYVYHQLEKYQAELKAHVVFVTASPNLSDEDKQRIDGMGVSVLHRENRGYDFGSYYAGISAFDAHLEQFERVFFTNDSVYGPFCSLPSLCERMDGSGLGFWGLTDCFKIDYHIQSYFLCLRGRAIPLLKKFFENYTFHDSYREVIENGEVGLSQFMVKSGITVGAAYPIEKYVAPYIVRHQNRRENSKRFVKGLSRLRWYSLWHRALLISPSYFLWKPMMKDGYPFLKKKLLLEWDNFGTHSGEWLSMVTDEEYKSACLAQASIHRDCGKLPCLKDESKKYRLLQPFTYYGMKKTWTRFLRDLVNL